MKSAIRILLAVAMSVTFVNCSEDDGGGGGGGNKNARTPDRRGCLYDTRIQDYRDRDGRRCDYDEFHDKNACYNFYFHPHTDWTRTDSHYNRAGYRDYDGYFTNKRNVVVNCDLTYIGQSNYFPYFRFDPQRGFVGGCEFWGYGLERVPLGNNAFVCVYNNFNSAYPIYNNAGWNTYYNYGYSPGWYYDSDYSTSDYIRDGLIGVGVGALLWHAFN